MGIRMDVFVYYLKDVLQEPVHWLFRREFAFASAPEAPQKSSARQRTCKQKLSLSIRNYRLNDDMFSLSEVGLNGLSDGD